MSERKVLNKYYPPDFDPSKIPRVKRDHNKTFTVRLMAPFNMKCTTCGEYIYKGRKFNARKEDVENEDFLGLRIYRFYIKCTRCLAEISFKTDPASTDYVIDAGATRNFMALKMAEEQAAKEEEARKEVEASNPMQMLENRTKHSREEIEAIEALEELREMNKRQQTLNYEGMLDSYEVSRQKARELQIKKAEEEDEELVNRYFGTKDDGTKIKRLVDDDGPQPKIAKSDIKKGSAALPQLPKGLHMTKPTLAGLIKKKEPAKPGQAQCAGGKPNQLISTSDVVKRVVDDAPSLVIPVQASKDRPIAEEPVKVEVLAKEQSSSSSGLPGITAVGNDAVSESFSYATSAVGNSRTKSTKIKATGLSLLGAYSSESDSSDD